MVTDITIFPDRLSDGSVAFNVCVGERNKPDDYVLFYAISEADADAFASTVAKAIADHTVDEVRIRWAETA